MGNNKRYSFFQLFNKGTKERPGNYKLIIPIIQRDYAQGRSNEKANEVRVEFLDQLAEYMTMSSGSRDLDFVYGMSSPAGDSSNKKQFVPLDGQQRLTTLFLIHLYLAIRIDGTDEAQQFFSVLRIKNSKLTENAFSYLTRQSAQEFCNGLISETADYSEFFETDEKEERKYKKNLSDFIRNSYWFYPDWVNDPTVSGMLTMLDEIDKKFKDTDHLGIFRRLIDEVDPSVTFIFMDLEDFKMTDDLYIKMNSRGKPLTPFENFKAKFEQYIGQLEAGKKIYDDEEDQCDNCHVIITDGKGRRRRIAKSIFDFGNEIANRGDKIINSVKDNFSFNIDTNWSKVFWEYSKEELKQVEAKFRKETNADANHKRSMDNLLSKILDTKISRFIRMVLVNQYAIENDSAVPDDLTSEKELSYSGLRHLITADGVVLMTKMFEMLANRPASILPEWTHRYYDERGVINSIVKGDNFNYTKRFLHYAYSMFRLEFGDTHTAELAEWMRFCYNLTYDDNARQDLTKDTYPRAISATNDILKQLKKLPSKSINVLLNSEMRPNDVKFFPDYQYREEILKSCLLSKTDTNLLHREEKPELDTELSESDSWDKIILKLESHPYFTGQIGFILKMAGIDDYYTTHGNLDWTDTANVEYKKSVVKYGHIASRIFEGGYSARTLAKNSLFERAMLAENPGYYDCNLFNSTNKRAGSSNNLLRDRSWKSVLRISSGNTVVYDMVKVLFDSLDYDNPEKSLLDIVSRNNDIAPIWRKDMVRYDYLIPMCRNGFFYKSPDGHRVLIDRINFSNTDHEVYSYILYNEYMNKLWDDKIGWMEYKTSNSGYDEVPHIRVHIGDVTAKVKSYVNKENGELISHYIRIDTSGDEWLKTYLIENGFVKKTEAASVLRRQTLTRNPEKDIDKYRADVTSEIIDIFRQLANAIKEKGYGQRES